MFVWIVWAHLEWISYFCLTCVNKFKIYFVFCKIVSSNFRWVLCAFLNFSEKFKMLRINIRWMEVGDVYWSGKRVDLASISTSQDWQLFQFMIKITISLLNKHQTSMTMTMKTMTMKTTTMKTLTIKTTKMKTTTMNTMTRNTINYRSIFCWL